MERVMEATAILLLCYAAAVAVSILISALRHPVRGTTMKGRDSRES
jgi:hypothetical protein